jgi:deoxyribonuclease V
MLTLDCELPDLEAELRALLAQIPAGRVTTYGDLADALGCRSAARWVGEFMRNHDHAPRCACHRVIRQQGRIGIYRRDRPAAEKESSLRREGVRITDGVVESSEQLTYRDFRSERPLARLIALQSELARRVRLKPFRGTPRLAAGLDVSYRSGGAAIGACAVVEAPTGRVLWSSTQRHAVSLPYIPGLLAFRELPVLLSLFAEARRNWPSLELAFVDGNGILHPRGGGIAACFGVVADVRTVGIAKSLLCGRIDTAAKTGRPATILVNGRPAGLAVRRLPASRPVFVSPGQLVDLAGAARLARMFDFGHRLPEPVYWADRISRAEARKA